MNTGPFFFLQRTSFIVEAEPPLYLCNYMSGCNTVPAWYQILLSDFMLEFWYHREKEDNAGAETTKNWSACLIVAICWLWRRVAWLKLIWLAKIWYGLVITYGRMKNKFMKSNKRNMKQPGSEVEHRSSQPLDGCHEELMPLTNPNGWIQLSNPLSSTRGSQRTITSAVFF